MRKDARIKKVDRSMPINRIKDWREELKVPLRSAPHDAATGHLVDEDEDGSRRRRRKEDRRRRRKEDEDRSRRRKEDKRDGGGGKYGGSPEQLREKSHYQGRPWNLDRVNDEGLNGNDATMNDGQGVNIFVLDTGVDCEHDEFEGDRCENVGQSGNTLPGGSWRDKK